MPNKLAMERITFREKIVMKRRVLTCYQKNHPAHAMQKNALVVDTSDLLRALDRRTESELVAKCRWHFVGSSTEMLRPLDAVRLAMDLMQL